MLLEINNLCKSFGDTAIIKNISLQVDKGETVSIIGPSGPREIYPVAMCNHA